MSKRQDQAASNGPIETVRRLKTVFDHHCQSDPEREVDAINRSVERYNARVNEVDAIVKKAQAKLDTERESLIREVKEIEDTDARLQRAKPDGSAGSQAVDAYNAQVNARNQRVARLDARQEAYQQQFKAYEKSVRKLEAELTAQKQALDQARKRTDQWLNEHRRWRSAKEDVALYHDLNRTYAQMRLAAAPGGPVAEWDAALAQVQAMRQELARRAERQETESGHGLIVFSATVCGREPCHLVLDTGASLVTVPRWVVDCLGLQSRLGEEIEVRGVAGLRTKGPRLTIPRLSVLGIEAADVEAVVLSEPAPGIDGCLGLSFLNRFEWKIDKSQKPKLMLKQRSQ